MATRKKGQSNIFSLCIEKEGGSRSVRGATLENQKSSDSYRQGYFILFSVYFLHNFSEKSTMAETQIIVSDLKQNKNFCCFLFGLKCFFWLCIVVVEPECPFYTREIHSSTLKNREELQKLLQKNVDSFVRVV